MYIALTSAITKMEFHTAQDQIAGIEPWKPEFSGNVLMDPSHAIPASTKGLIRLNCGQVIPVDEKPEAILGLLNNK